MPVSINNTTLTFNDATTQTTSGVTSVSAGTGISVAGGKTPTVTNTGVTSVTAGSGISVSASTGSVTISASGGTGVTSLNGQTGAITTTNFDSIGATGVFMMGVNSNIAYNGTVAGSSLRYNYSSTGAASANSPFTHRFDGGSYGGGGTSTTGTWRKMSTGNTYVDTGCGTFNWWAHLYVRIS